MLYEPTGYVKELKRYSRSYKDRPITQAILPNLYEVVDNGGHKLIPKNISGYMAHRRYKRCIDNILKAAPGIKTMHLRSKAEQDNSEQLDVFKEQKTLKNVSKDGVTLRMGGRTLNKRSRSAPKQLQPPSDTDNAQSLLPPNMEAKLDDKTKALMGLKLKSIQGKERSEISDNEESLDEDEREALQALENMKWKYKETAIQTSVNYIGALTLDEPESKEKKQPSLYDDIITSYMEDQFMKNDALLAQAEYDKLKWLTPRMQKLFIEKRKR